MQLEPHSSKGDFFKQYLSALLFVLLIPGFSAWFFSHAERSTDRQIYAQLRADVLADATMGEARKQKFFSLYDKTPLSAIMASNHPKWIGLQVLFRPFRDRYTVFRWMKRTAWACMGATLATIVIVGASVAYSSRSQRALYLSLRVGWPVLRTAAAIQVVGQAALGVALSFWITGLFLEWYSLKIMGVVGFAAVFAVIALGRAICTRVELRCTVTGEILEESAAAGLWQRVRDLAASLKTLPPDRIIVGINQGFFVTEHAVTLGPEIYHGRTLYLSLPLLKILAVDEADAVLAHELAHFSGDDTFWACKVSPITEKFVIYLQRLSEGMSVVIVPFLTVFWELYGHSWRMQSRAREYRADKIGAELVSASAMMRALVKVSSHSEYRAKTEQTILGKRKVDRDLDLARELEQGFPAFLTAFRQDSSALEERTPHPFDTHPSLGHRLAVLGFDAKDALAGEAGDEASVQCWHRSIPTASVLEKRMWAGEQEAMQAYHAEALQWQLLPESEEEKVLVRERFPALSFARQDGAAATLDYDRVEVAGWGGPILFEEIIVADMDTFWMRSRLTLRKRDSESETVTQVRCFPKGFKDENGNLQDLFWHYYNRHLTAAARCGEMAG